MAARKKANRPRLRWWQHLCRGCALIVLAAAGAYATLPWWAPTGLLARRLAADLSGQLGVDVRIESVSLSWMDGVEVRGLEIDATPSFGREPIATFPSLRTELAPVDFLLHRRLAWLELTGPRVRVAFDEDGNSTLATLKGLLRGIAVQRIGVHCGRATLEAPGAAKRLALRIASFQLDAGRVREITMSAALEQDGNAGSAPISLSPGGATSVGGGGPSPSFTFSNIDLSRLPVAELTGLPLTTLAGRCDGVLALEPGRDTIIDAFTLDLRVRRLDARTDAVRLPVIEESRVRLRGVFDQIAESVRIKSASVRLPGADIEAEVEASAGLLAGHWEAIDSLRIEGRVRPAQLATVLTGETALPGGLMIGGPVAVSVGARRDGAQLRLRAEAQAGPAEVRRGGNVLKPAGRPCTMGFSGRLDHRTSEFRVTDSWLHLSDNRFTGHGALVSLRRFARRLAERQRRTPGQVVLAEMSRLNWSGKWEIDDLPALRQVADALAPDRALPDLRLTGPLTGRWFVQHGPATRVHVIFEAPAGTALRVPGVFEKPPDSVLHLHLDAAVDPNTSALTDPAAELIVGDAHLVMDRVHAAWGESAELRGRVAVDRVERILACLPGAEAIRGKLTGGLTGQFDVLHRTDGRRIRLSSILTDAAVDLEPWLRKPAGQAAELQVDMRSGPGAGERRPWLLTFTWAGAQADVTVNVNLPALRPGESPAAAWARPFEADLDWVAEAVVKDAQRLTASSPALVKHLGSGSLSGQVKLSGRGKLRNGVLDGEVLCDATDLAFALAGGRAKLAGTQLSLRLDGQVVPKKGRIHVRLREGEAALGDSRLSLAGSADVLTGPPPHGRTHRPVPLGRLDLNADLLVTIQPALLGLAPELAGPVERSGLSGTLSCRTRAQSDGNALRLLSQVDETALGLGGLTLPIPPAEDAIDLVRQIGRVTKPLGFPATLDLDANVPWDLSRVRVGVARMRVGGSSLEVSGSAALTPGANGLPGGAREGSGRLIASISRAEELARLVPRWKPLRLSGGASAQLQLSPGGGNGLARAEVQFDDLRWTYAGKAMGLDGSLHVEKLLPPRADPNGLDGLTDEQWARRVADAMPRIGRLHTDGLEVRAGDSHGWLVADLSSLPERPTGSFHVLAERLDLEEMERGFAPGKPAATRPARPSYKLTAAETRALRRQAARLGQLTRRLLGRADVSGRASIQRLRSYDISVDRTYGLHKLEMTFSAKQGRIALDWSAGMSGGLLRDSHRVDLSVKTPTVTTESVVDRILAEEDIQPQLAKFFPGNTVSGTFSRRQTSMAPLAEAIALGLDPRYPIHPVGAGKTVATEGLTQGRAAPEFMTNIFPGLNLAKYRYKKMTAFADLRADGTVKNDMVFDGKLYDLYMEGTTDANNIGRYEIGLILLGTPQTAEFNHAYRQGRIPLLNMKARIEGGKMHDQQVSYLWPNETLFVVFLKNNIFYRLWLAANKNE